MDGQTTSSQQQREQGSASVSLPFIDIKDSPIFRSKVGELERTSAALSTRTKKLLQGASQYCHALDDAFQASLQFSDCIESCSGIRGVDGLGGDDDVGLQLGGPVLHRFVQSMKEMSSFLELLRTQVELIICDGLGSRSEGLYGAIKNAEKRLQQKTSEYDGVRSKHLGHHGKRLGQKNSTTKQEVVVQARVEADEARFDLAKALVKAQGDYKFEVIEAVANVMQSQVKYFEHGHAVAQGLLPYIDESLKYVEALKADSKAKMGKLDELIEYERACLRDHDLKVSRAEEERLKTEYGLDDVGAEIGKQNTRNTTLASELEALIQQTRASGNALVTILKQGYLLKRSSTMRNKWQRRFFVLDSTGMLYYYSTKSEGINVGDLIRKSGANQHPHTTVNLLTAAVKPGLPNDEKPVPYAFRIVSPEREYYLQAEDEVDASSWIETLQSVIVCLLSGAFQSTDIKVPEVNVSPIRPTHSRDMSGDMSSLMANFNLMEEKQDVNRRDGPDVILAQVPGNDVCADCRARKPEWGSINLGSLHCIECSGIHRKLGVHVSKIRSLTLDTRVWDEHMVSLFKVLGNDVVNSIWEANLDQSLKPQPSSPASVKESYIIEKYVKKAFVEPRSGDGSWNDDLWEGIKKNDILACYRAMVHSQGAPKSPIQPAKILATNVGSTFQEHEDFLPTALHFACHCGNVLVVVLLLVSGKYSIDVQDGSGRNPLMYALYFDKPEIAKILLAYGSSPKIVDFEGFTPFIWLKKKCPRSTQCAGDPDLLKDLIN